MTPFAALLAELDTAADAHARRAALGAYLRHTHPGEDKVWALALLTGRAPRRGVSTAQLSDWVCKATGTPDWLFAHSRSVVGDLGETIALLLPRPSGAGPSLPLASFLATLSGLVKDPSITDGSALVALLQALPAPARVVAAKLMTGTLRIAMPTAEVIGTLAHETRRDEVVLTARLSGNWPADSTSFSALIGDETTPASQAFPFAAPNLLSGPADSLGNAADWIAEWSWDGLRSQLINRDGRLAIWSDTGNLVNDRFPDLAGLATALPADTALDGMILAYPPGAEPLAAQPLSRAELDRRFARKALAKPLLARAPARFLAFDLLQEAGRDLRELPFAQRRTRLQALIAALPASAPIAVSPVLPFADWATLAALREKARDGLCTGVTVRRADAAYPADAGQDDTWFDWRLDPHRITAVLIYAHAEAQDFTFALRHGNGLVPVTRTASGLTASDLAAVIRWSGAHVIERFGPTRRVAPELVFDIGFDAVLPSPRHKCGLALRHPRILAWRRDLAADQIDSLDSLTRTLPTKPG